MASAVDTFIVNDRLFMVVGSHSNDTDMCFGPEWDMNMDTLVTHQQGIGFIHFHHVFSEWIMNSIQILTAMRGMFKIIGP